MQVKTLPVKSWTRLLHILHPREKNMLIRELNHKLLWICICCKWSNYSLQPENWPFPVNSWEQTSHFYENSGWAKCLQVVLSSLSARKIHGPSELTSHLALCWMTQQIWKCCVDSRTQGQPLNQASTSGQKPGVLSKNPPLNDLQPLVLYCLSIFFLCFVYKTQNTLLGSCVCGFQLWVA